jgi:hypothetical protein
VERPDEVRPDFPWRRMIAVSVFFGGLIGPAVLLAFRLLATEWSAAGGAFLLLVMAGWLAQGLREIWKGSYRAYQTAIVIFALGVAFSLLVLYPAAVSGGVRALALPGAAFLFFAAGLAALISVDGPWLYKN